MANRLQYETSPYLLQHANNPVDWYPWAEEAFKKAAAENKPVLVSIGYAACHWCHVMEHESFEDKKVAAVMNEKFVCIKVDREEHPDVDHLYMDAVQSMTGSGGWPLNVFVTPEKNPFYGGTYFPPERRYGRASWTEVLIAIDRTWHEKPEEVALQARQMIQHLQQASLVGNLSPGANAAITENDIQSIAENIMKQADAQHGGFGAAPKFPATGAIQFLLEYAHFNKETSELSRSALNQALFSLDKMLEGGIYDQLGGGFARYATDNEWLIPHFEKMLYDNALLVDVLSTAYRVSSKARYAEIIRETIDFCERELSGNGFGYFAALDADSEGVEGKYYTWDPEEWKQIVDNIHPATSFYFGVTEEGNWEHTNILSAAMPEAEVLKQFQLNEDSWRAILKRDKEVLLDIRSRRIRPGLDNKVILSWNALFNKALVSAYFALQDESYLLKAVEHMNRLLQTFENGTSLLHVATGGKAKIRAKLDDYAYLIDALLVLSSVSGDHNYIRIAYEKAMQVQSHYLADDKVFFYFSSKEQEDIVVGKIDTYDGATPSANAIMCRNLRLLGELMEESSWIEQSELMMQTIKSSVIRYPTSFSVWATELQRNFKNYKHIVFAGAEATAFWEEWGAAYHPEVYTSLLKAPFDGIPALRGKYSEDIGSRAYLCSNFSCSAPVASVEALNVLLSR